MFTISFALLRYFLFVLKEQNAQKAKNIAKKAYLQ